LKAKFGPNEGALSKQSEELEARHVLAVKELLSDLSTYLTSAAVPATLLPTTAPVVMRRVAEAGSCGGHKGRKEVRFQMRVLGTTTAADVLEAAEKQFSSAGDEIVHLNSTRLVIRPIGHNKPAANLAADAATYGEVGDDGQLTRTVALDDPVPLFKLAPGGRLDGGSWELCLEGDFSVKSDNQVCFSLEFQKDSPTPQLVDYYHCRTCNIKWVCSRCAVTCHAGHDVCLYLQNHQPTWACCYCAKKKAKTGCRLCSSGVCHNKS